MPFLSKVPKGKRKVAKPAQDQRVRKNPVEEAKKKRQMRAELARVQRREQRLREKGLLVFYYPIIVLFTPHNRPSPNPTTSSWSQ